MSKIIKEVQFLDGVKNKQVLVLDYIGDTTLYILKEELKHYDNGKNYLVNPMIERDGVLYFSPYNYSKVKGMTDKQKSQLVKLMVKGETSYYQHNKYKVYYDELESALDVWRDDHDLDSKMSYQEIARDVIRFVNEQFNYIDASHDRGVNFLQGLGLSIPYTYHDIYQLAYKSNRLKESDSDKAHERISTNYWSFMYMRLKNIAKI